VTAPELAAYQAKVDAAAAAQAVAAQNLQMATLTSPISGTVMSVGLAAGASSGSDGIIVSAPDGVVYTTSVPVATIPEVAVGQAVSVLRDGTATPLAGKVVAVAAAPASSGDYTVTVGLTDEPAGVRSGSTASLTLSLAAATNVLTVPTSAVSTIGTIHLVRVLSGGKLRTVRVTLGTQGAILTQVTGALTVGEKVVLADLNEAVPASNTDTTTTGGTGLGGLGGGFGTTTGTGTGTGTARRAAG
jgi:multidrug efflux pump subunit AcrA (membrane-fusion protein)